MKILCIQEDYVNGYWDWMLGEAAGRIIEEGFTHIMNWEGDIMRVEIVISPISGEKLVDIREQIN